MTSDPTREHPYRMPSPFSDRELAEFAENPWGVSNPGAAIYDLAVSLIAARTQVAPAGYVIACNDDAGLIADGDVMSTAAGARSAQRYMAERDPGAGWAAYALIPISEEATDGQP